MPARTLFLVSLFFVSVVAAACDSEPKQDPDSGTAGTSAGEGGEGGTAATGGTGATSGSGGSGATSGEGGSGGSGATSGDGGSGGTSGAGATGGSGGGGTGCEGRCNTPSDCNDNIDCTADECLDGRCTNVIDATLCSAGQVCDLREGGCSASTPCGSNPDCVDSDPCTRNERCNLSAAACEWDLLDTDNDGHPPITCGGDDFDDADGSRYPCAIDVCDGNDNDGDGSVDPEPQTSERCGMVPNGASACVSGSCSLSCDEGWADCDAVRANGCETDLASDSQNCGECGYTCSDCVQGTCDVDACLSAPDEAAMARLYTQAGLTASIWAWQMRCVRDCEGAAAPDICQRDCLGQIVGSAFTDGCLMCLGKYGGCFGTSCLGTCSFDNECAACACTNGCSEAFNICSGRTQFECN